MDNLLRTSPFQKDQSRNTGRPQAYIPKTGLNLFTFSDLKNAYLDLLVMIKAHDKERKTGVHRLKPQRTKTK